MTIKRKLRKAIAEEVLQFIKAKEGQRKMIFGRPFEFSGGKWVPSGSGAARRGEYERKVAPKPDRAPGPPPIVKKPSMPPSEKKPSKDDFQGRNQKLRIWALRHEKQAKKRVERRRSFYEKHSSKSSTALRNMGDKFHEKAKIAKINYIMKPSKETKEAWLKLKEAETFSFDLAYKKDKEKGFI